MSGNINTWTRLQYICLLAIDDGLQVGWQDGHYSLHVSLQPLLHNVSQRQLFLLRLGQLSPDPQHHVHQLHFGLSLHPVADLGFGETLQVKKCELGRHLRGASVVPAHKVWTLEEPPVEAGPVAPGAGGQLRPTGLQRAQEVFTVERPDLGDSQTDGGTRDQSVAFPRASCVDIFKFIFTLCYSVSIAVAGWYLGRGSVGRDGLGEGHQAGHVAFQRYYECLQ